MQRKKNTHKCDSLRVFNAWTTTKSMKDVISSAAENNEMRQKNSREEPRSNVREWARSFYSNDENRRPQKQQRRLQGVSGSGCNRSYNSSSTRMKETMKSSGNRHYDITLRMSGWATRNNTKAYEKVRSIFSLSSLHSVVVFSLDFALHGLAIL